MFRKIDDFLSSWTHEHDATMKVLQALTDDSLSQRVYDGGRTLGYLAWHITLTLSEMMNRTGLTVQGPAHDAPAPSSAADIAAAYSASSASLVQEIKDKWTDETLTETDDMYGETWPRGITLAVLINHQAHHRGQVTVLMRQAGLSVPGVYGPSKEEWVAYGMEPLN